MDRGLKGSCWTRRGYTKPCFFVLWVVCVFGIYVSTRLISYFQFEKVELSHSNTIISSPQNPITVKSRETFPTTTGSIESRQSVFSNQSTPMSTTSDPYVCTFPSLNPDDPTILKHVSKFSPMRCSYGRKPSLVFLDGDVLRIDHNKVKQRVGIIDACLYLPISLSEKSENQLKPVKWSNGFTDYIKLPIDVEHVLVHCIKKGEVVGETFKSRIIEKHKVEERSENFYQRHMKDNSPAETLSVLFVGIDGMSKQSLVRSMPKTRDFITKYMNAKELNKFNKIGDNTYANVIPLLTGYTPELLQNITNFNPEKTHFDEIDKSFIWRQFQDAGYRTALMLDAVGISAFHYLKKGWKKPPFDYYHRPLALAMMHGSKTPIQRTHCVGESRKVSLLLDYWLQLTTTFNNSKTKPYFAYSFFTYLTHYDANHASLGDEMYLQFFQDLHSKNVLNNTLLIFFSDHGPRFGGMRLTLNGMVEMKTPFFFFMFPPWFEKKYPKEMSNFNINQNRLTTFTDIHATLSDLLNFRSNKSNKQHKGLGLSLLQEVPSDRSCQDAHIPLEYCACSDFSKIEITGHQAEDMAREVLHIVNSFTSSIRQDCAELSLKSILSVYYLQKTKQIHHQYDPYYQVTIETTPGGGQFEALIKYNKHSNSVTLIGDIIRLNLYQGQDKCVNLIALKPFCFCKTLKKQ